MKKTALVLLLTGFFVSGCVNPAVTPIITPEAESTLTVLPPTATPLPLHPCLAGGIENDWLTPRTFTAAYTPDGLRLYRPREVLSAALLVDGIEIDKQSAVLYYLDGDGMLKTGQINEEDTQFIGEVKLEGLEVRGVSDIDVVRMEDGSVRMVTLVNSEKAGFVCLSESQDGQNFAMLANPLLLEAGIEWRSLSFIELTDRSWLLAVQGGDMVRLWRSPDGVVFIPFNELDLGVDPEFALALRGKVRLYLNQDQVVSYTSEDGGEKWEKEQIIPLPKGSSAPTYIPVTRLLVYAYGD